MKKMKVLVVFTTLLVVPVILTGCVSPYMDRPPLEGYYSGPTAVFVDPYPYGNNDGYYPYGREGHRYNPGYNPRYEGPRYYNPGYRDHRGGNFVPNVVYRENHGGGVYNPHKSRGSNNGRGVQNQNNDGRHDYHR